MKKTNIINILAGIGAVSILLISFSVALNPNDAQQALSLGGLTGAPSPSPAPSGGVASTPASPNAPSAYCGYMNEWRDSFYPNDVFMAGNGNIYIANSKSDDIKGRVLIERSAGGEQYIGDGARDGVKIIDARDVLAYKDGKNDYLFVADYGDGVGSGQVVQYSYVGDTYTFKNKWTVKSMKGLASFRPTHFASYKVGVDFYLAIVNSADNTILKLRPNDVSTYPLSVWATLPKASTAPIVGMASTSANIYISISNGSYNKVLKFPLAGVKAEKSWGETGSADWQFGSIQDIAVYKVPNFWATYVYVADPGRGRILQFDSDGNYVSAYEGTYNGKNFLQHPGGMTIGPDNQLYFTDSTDGRIYKFGTTECVIMKVTKDFLPTTDPRDFRFNILFQKPGLPTFSADLSLDDDPNDNALSNSRSFNLFRGSGSNSAIVTELDDYGSQIEISRECKYGTGIIVPNAPGNSASVDLYYGGPYNCIFKNSLKKNRIVVIKKVDPEYDSTDFNFSLSTFPDFTLDDDSIDKNPYSNSQSFDVTPGKNYTLSEKDLPPGIYRTKASYECVFTDGNGAIVKNADGTDKVKKSSEVHVFGGKSVDLSVAEGETATCTFTNKLPNSRISIRKDATPNTPANKFFYFDFKDGYDQSVTSFKLYDNIKSSRLLFTYDTDNYTITETPDPAYKTFVSCVDTGKKIIIPRTESRTLNIGPADFSKANFLTCTFENELITKTGGSGVVGGGGSGGGEQ